MKTLLTVGLALSFSVTAHTQSPYFGQKTPGLTAEVFAPGLVSVEGRYEGSVNFSPTLDEMYFSPTINGHSEVHVSRLVNGQWTRLEKADFTKGKIKDEFSPWVSYDNNRVYFSTWSEQYPLKIWYLERHQNGWGEARLLESPINKEQVIMSSEASNGDLYYINSSRNKMYVTRNQNGRFPEGQAVTIPYGNLGFISPAQDFMLVEAYKDNDKSKKLDVFVYFKNPDGSWSDPVDLGPAVNTNYREGAPTMTPDGKYLFFNRYDEPSGNPNVYWISAEVIESVRPKS